MKKVFFINTSILLSVNLSAQNVPDKLLYEKYVNQKYSSFDYIRIARIAGWYPVNLNVTMSKFEDIFIKATTDDSKLLKGLAVENCYMCALDRQFLYQKYISRYKRIEVEFWNEYCPVLNALMDIDKE